MPFPADHFASTATPLLRLNQRPWKIFYRGLTPKPLRNKINAHRRIMAAFPASLLSRTAAPF